MLNIDNECMLDLKDILHTPDAVINLLYVNKLCKDNKVYVEFDFSGFFVKDIQIKEIIL